MGAAWCARDGDYRAVGLAFGRGGVETMKTQFNERQVAALKTMGLPTTTDEFFEDDESYMDYSRAIKKEMLGPGLDDNGDLNEYGDALRSCLDVIASAEWELYGPPDYDAILAEVARRRAAGGGD